MSISLESWAKQVTLYFCPSSLSKKVSFPLDWRVNSGEEEDLQAFIKLSQSRPQRTLLVLSEELYFNLIKKWQAEKYSPLRLGILLITNQEINPLSQSHDSPHLLDVVSEKDFKKNTVFHIAKVLRLLARSEDKVNRRFNQKTLEKLNENFISLSAERDPEKLLSSIMKKAIDLAISEAGMLYLVHEKEGEVYFRIKVTIDKDQKVTLAPVDLKVLENSVSGYVALTGKTVNIEDVSEIRPMTIPQVNRLLDPTVEPLKSLMAVPLKNSRNEIIAVLHLINKKADSESILEQDASEKLCFEKEDESLLASFTTQAAICLETVDLYADIQRLFEGFVKASITAIESRDPSTGGHSERVAKLCVGLAKATTEVDSGVYRSVKFKEEEIRELEYAALLHDFGKIGVREEVLVKAKKLYPWQLDSIKERIKNGKAAAKIAYLEKSIKSGGENAALNKEYQQKIDEIDYYWRVILEANEPAVLKKEKLEALDKVKSETLLLPDGSSIILLTDEEYKALSVTRGSLTESERLEIESHVRHTYQFLKMIPWTKDFKRLPEIAYGHHEKLDGTGYPRGLTSHEIPLQSKIMTIADIFDALTAADRWYKEAVPTKKALEILAFEVGEGKLDPVLYEIFVEKKIYEVTQAKVLSRIA